MGHNVNYIEIFNKKINLGSPCEWKMSYALEKLGLYNIVYWTDFENTQLDQNDKIKMQQISDICVGKSIIRSIDLTEDYSEPSQHHFFADLLG